MNSKIKCPIWGTEATLLSDNYNRYGGQLIDSKRAGGEYIASQHARDALADSKLEEKARLTSWIIDQHCSGTNQPKIGDLFGVYSSFDKEKLPPH